LDNLFYKGETMCGKAMRSRSELEWVGLMHRSRHVVPFLVVSLLLCVVAGRSSPCITDFCCMHAGGVRLLVELAAMAHLQSQAITLGRGGPALLMDHAQADMDAVASWWYYEGLAPRAVSTGAEGRESPEIGGA
jgi:hypothetical protein